MLGDVLSLGEREAVRLGLSVFDDDWLLDSVWLGELDLVSLADPDWLGETDAEGLTEAVEELDRD